MAHVPHAPRPILAVFCGGGTLGPVTPLLAAAAALRERVPGAEFLWIGTAAGPERAIVGRAGIPFRAVSSGKLRRYFSLENFLDYFRIAAGFLHCLFLLRRRPSVVVSAGGFVAVPAVWAAGLLGIPVHVHQQDRIAGLANRLSMPCAKSVSVALRDSLTDFAAKRPEWTGNPVRPEILAGSAEEGRRIFGLERGVPTVLVLGGGTGAAAVNDLVRGSLPRLLAGAQVIHVAGRGKSAGTEGIARYCERELLTAEMPHALAAADLIVTRAGMGTLSELAALGKPAVIIPIPDSHQEANAAVFAGAAQVLSQQGLAAETFGTIVAGLATDRARLSQMAEAMRGMSRPDAAGRVAAMILAAAAPAPSGVRG